jgi:hypothetical protein
LHAGPGIYHGNLNFESTTDDLIDAAQLFPYPSFSSSPSSQPGTDTAEVPISIALTEFHFLILFRNRIVGVCTLDEKLAYEEYLQLVKILSTLGVILF